ncbi:MAG: hypothetical protein AAB425_04675, partial [Bdellovibrionota bacterium]
TCSLNRDPSLYFSMGSSRFNRLRMTAGITMLFCIVTLLSGRGWAATNTPRFLFVGDSHTVGTFGHTLDQDLRDWDDQVQVATVGVCGSSPLWWLDRHAFRCGLWAKGADEVTTSLAKGKTPSLSRLLDSARPTHILVALGSNLFGTEVSHVTAQVTRFLEVALAPTQEDQPAPTCFWIGPPNGRNKPEPELSQLYEAISETAHDLGCTLIDSRPLTDYPAVGGDGAHFDSLGAPGREIARAWAHAVSEEIKKSSE